MCWICSLSHGVVRTSEYGVHNSWVGPGLGSSVVRAPGIYLKDLGEGRVQILAWSLFCTDPQPLRVSQFKLRSQSTAPKAPNGQLDTLVLKPPYLLRQEYSSKVNVRQRHVHRVTASVCTAGLVSCLSNKDYDGNVLAFTLEKNVDRHCNSGPKRWRTAMKVCGHCYNQCWLC